MHNKRKNSFRLYFIVVFSLIILASSLALTQINTNYLPLVEVISTNESGVQYRKSYGVMVKIGNENVILTDYFVVEEVDAAKVVIDKGATLDADVIKDPKTQTAMLIPKSKKEIDSKNTYTYQIGDSSSLIPGEKLFIPNGNGLKDAGIMESILPSFSVYYSPVLMTTFKSPSTDSGKPVLNYRDEVIGIVIFYQKDRIIVPINIIKSTYYNYYKKDQKIIRDTQENIETGLPISIGTESERLSNKTNIKSIYSKNNNCFFGNIDKIQFGVDKSIYVLDSFYKLIYKFDENYNLIYDSNKAPVIAKLENPISFAVTTGGLVYVLENQTNSSIKRYNRELKLIDEINLKDVSYKDEKGKTQKPNTKLPCYDIETGNERVYVLSKNKILIFDEKLNMLKEIGGNGTATDRFKTATDIVALNDDSFAVLDQKGGKVKLFDRDGKYILEFPINAPVDNAISSFRGDAIIVVDKSNSKIKLFDKEGKFIRLYQVDSNSPYGVPKGLIFDEKELLHIYYENQPLINVFNITGTLMSTTSSFTFDDHKNANSVYNVYNKYTIYNPKNIAITRNKLIMVDQDNNLHLFERNIKTKEETGKISENETKKEKQMTAIIDSQTISLPINYRFNISGIVGDINTDTIYFSESIKGTIFKLDLSSENAKCEELLLKLKSLAYDFIPVLVHYDGEILYIIDKMNQRIITTYTDGVIKDITSISNDTKDGSLPVIDITTTSSGQEIFVLTKIKDKFYIHEYTKKWKEKQRFEVKSDFVLGFPKGICINNNNIYILDPLENAILNYDVNTHKKSSNTPLPTQIGISYLNNPVDVVLENGLMYVLDNKNNRTIEYSLSESTSNK